jgi:DNA-binding transcriptional ArsR family regulator
VSDQKPELDALFHALGDPTRRAIVERLSERPHSVSALAGPLGVTLTAVAQHLQVLEAAGLVRTEKLGRVRTAQLHAKGLDLLDRWTRERRSIWDHRFDRLADIVGGGQDSE